MSLDSLFFYTYVEWYFQGNYQDVNPSGTNNVLKFSYEIYYMSGSTKYVVLSSETEYNSNQNWNDNFVSHYLSGYTYSASIDYYISIQILL